MNNADHLDLELCFVLRAMWALLGYTAFCVLCFVCLMYADPESALGVYNSVPVMTECLLAGCAVTLGLGALFQYLGGR